MSDLSGAVVARSRRGGRLVAVRPRTAPPLGARRGDGARRLGDPRCAAAARRSGRRSAGRRGPRGPAGESPATGCPRSVRSRSIWSRTSPTSARCSSRRSPRRCRCSPSRPPSPPSSRRSSSASAWALRAVAGLLLVVVGALLLTLRDGSGLRGFFSGLLEDRGCRLMVGVALLWSATLLLDKRALAAGTPHLHALVLNGGVAVGALGGARGARRPANARELCAAAAGC